MGPEEALAEVLAGRHVDERVVAGLACDAREHAAHGRLLAELEAARDDVFATTRRWSRGACDDAALERALRAVAAGLPYPGYGDVARPRGEGDHVVERDWIAVIDGAIAVAVARVREVAKRAVLAAASTTAGADALAAVAWRAIAAPDGPSAADAAFAEALRRPADATAAWWDQIGEAARRAETRWQRAHARTRLAVP